MWILKKDRWAGGNRPVWTLIRKMIIYSYISFLWFIYFVWASTNFETSYNNRFWKCGKDITETEQAHWSQKKKTLCKFFKVPNFAEKDQSDGGKINQFLFLFDSILWIYKIIKFNSRKKLQCSTCCIETLTLDVLRYYKKVSCWMQ